MRRTLILGALLLAAAAVPPGASGATWSVPVDVSSPANFILTQFIGFDRSGVGFAAWSWQDGIGNGARVGLRVSSRTVAGSFATEREAPGAAAPPVIYGDGRVVLLDESGMVFRKHRPPRARVRVVFGRTDGRFGAPRTIDTVAPFRAPAVAANDAGQVAVAYLHLNRREERIATLAVKHGRRFERPRIVTNRGNLRNITVAVGPRGDLVVAWARGGLIEARIRRPGHSLGPIVRVGRSEKAAIPTLRAAVAASGRVWIVWGWQVLEDGYFGPVTLKTAVSDRRGSRFRRARLLDRYNRNLGEGTAFDLALDERGRGLVAWSTSDGKNVRARLGFAHGSGRFTRFVTLSQPGYDALMGDLAVGKAGEAIVVWSRLDAVGEVSTSVLAGYVPATGGYRGEEQVSRGDRASGPAVAFDPRSGLPTAVWSQREGPDGPDVPLEQVRTFLRAATRTP